MSIYKNELEFCKDTVKGVKKRMQDIQSDLNFVVSALEKMELSDANVRCRMFALSALRYPARILAEMAALERELERLPENK